MEVLHYSVQYTEVMNFKRKLTFVTILCLLSHFIVFVHGV